MAHGVHDHTRTMGSRARERMTARRGFTLVELMAVVIIVAVLAVLAVVSYRRYMIAGRITEAIAMVGNIRGAEETYRAETMQYLSVSTLMSSWYPAAASFSGGSVKTSWVMTGHADYAKWQQLSVKSDGPVVFGYAVQAVAPGTAYATGITGWPSMRCGSSLSACTGLSGSATDPFYYIIAQGDGDADSSTKSYATGSSASNEIYTEGEGN